MSGSVWLYILIAVCFVGNASIDAASIKKKASLKEEAVPEKAASPKSTKTTSNGKSAAPAILAIEIIDEDEPEAGSKKKNTSKRTIESSLGYGYNSYFGTTRNEIPKKFEIYPYSQHDIPPLPPKKAAGSSFGYSGNAGHGASYISQGSGGFHGHGNGQFEIQKSVSYDLGTHTTRIKAPQAQIKFPSAYYQKPTTTTSGFVSKPSPLHPGTTLYSVVDHGHASHLSSSFPSNQVSHHGPKGDPQVPVIVLRVYSHQLQTPGALYPNLPQSNPYSSLNTINLQSLLSGYLQQQGYQVQPGAQGDYYEYPEQTYEYQPQYQTETHATHAQAQKYSTAPQVFPRGGASNKPPIAENYPDDVHTRIVFTPDNSASYRSASHSSATPVALPSRQPQPPQHYQNRGYPKHTSVNYGSGNAPNNNKGYSQKLAPQSEPVNYEFQHQVPQNEPPQYVYEDIGQDSSAGQYYGGNGVDYSQVYENQPTNQHSQYLDEEPSYHRDGSSELVHNNNNQQHYQTTTTAPFNYHAHLASAGVKQQRNKKRLATTEEPINSSKDKSRAEERSSFKLEILD